MVFSIYHVPSIFSPIFWGLKFGRPKEKIAKPHHFLPLFPFSSKHSSLPFFPSLSFWLNQMDCKHFFFPQCTTNLHSFIRLSNGLDAKWLRVESPLSMGFILLNLAFFSFNNQLIQRIGLSYISNWWRFMVVWSSSIEMNTCHHLDKFNATKHWTQSLTLRWHGLIEIGQITIFGCNIVGLDGYVTQAHMKM